jgi:hypothetical protein
LRHFLGAGLFYAEKFTRGVAARNRRRDYRQYVPPDDSYVLDCAYHAGKACAEIGKPDKALPQLRFLRAERRHVGGRGRAEDPRIPFRHRPDARRRRVHRRNLSELQSVRPLLADAFGVDSTHVRNLSKQIARLESA